MATSAASTPQAQVQPEQAKTWTIQPTDGRLAVTLERWAKQDGMRLVWDAQQHVLLSTSDTFKGTLQEALNRVLTSPAIRLSAYPLEACIYPNEPPVLRITRAGLLRCANLTAIAAEGGRMQCNAMQTVRLRPPVHWCTRLYR